MSFWSYFIQTLSKRGKYLIIQIYTGHKSFINQIILSYQKSLKK